jgi:glycosyltransferase involved in cell wall biosynthesis
MTERVTNMRRIRDASTAAITVIIPTRDEALHIRCCVASARPLGRVIVVDSGSTDATRRIAAEHGAEVVEHAWEGPAAQKNWALASLDITTPWVLFLDADEYLTLETRDAVRAAAASGGAQGYELPRAYVFLGKRLRYAWWYPDYQLRLFRRGRGRFEDRLVHEHVIVDGPVAQIDAPIMHENLKGLSAFIERHNRYSDLEVAELTAPSRDRKPGSLRGSWAQRRRAMKDRIWFHVPARPLVRFLWLYVLRRGFLDGRRGLLFCQLIAMYDFMIDAKLTERKLAIARKTPIAGAGALRPATAEAETDPLAPERDERAS